MKLTLEHKLNTLYPFDNKVESELITNFKTFMRP